MTFFIFKDRAGQWRWNLVASNGKVVADSGEGYYNKQDCMHGIRLVMGTSTSTPIYER